MSTTKIVTKTITAADLQPGMTIWDEDGFTVRQHKVIANATQPGHTANNEICWLLDCEMDEKRENIDVVYDFDEEVEIAQTVASVELCFDTDDQLAELVQALRDGARLFRIAGHSAPTTDKQSAANAKSDLLELAADSVGSAETNR